jgi:predicted ester cyclase
MTSLDETRQVIDKYLHGHDTSALADNAVFEVMASGQRANGRAAIEQLMNYFYTQAFTAEFTPRSVTLGEGKAVLEADFHGKQNLEFAGIQPSGNEVHVPLCVCYDLSNGKITNARIYFETDALRVRK